jgi:MFS family permease
MSRYSKTRSAILYATNHFFIFAFHWAMILYLPLFFKGCGLNDALIGILISLFSLATIILIFPLGVLADRLNPKILFLSGACCAVIFNLVMPYMQSLWAMCALMLFGGGAISLMLISISALFIKQMGIEQRGGQVAIFNTGSIMGAGISAYFSGWFYLWKGDISVIFWLAAAYSALAILTGLLLPSVKGIPFSVLEYKQDMRHAWMWILIFVVAITASHAGFEHAGYTLLQTEVIGLDAEQVGRAFFYISLWMAAITLFAGRLHDRLSRPLIMLGTAMIISGIFQAASAHAHDFLEFLTLRLAHTFGDSFSTLIIPVVAATIFPTRRIGGTYAFILTVNTASYFLFANIGGIMNQNMGFQASFEFSGALLLAGGIIAIFIIRPRLRARSSHFN